MAVVCVASVVVGQAILSVAGARRSGWLSGAVGLAALLVIAGIAVKLPGHGTAVAIVVAIVVAASGVALILRPPEQRAVDALHGVVAAMIALVVASLPFIAAGKTGILGVGLVNDDMASHLLITSWLDERFVPEPVLIGQGYPLGPHALVAGLSKTAGGDPIDAFAGLTLAIPALTAMVAFGALERLRPPARTVAAAAVALPYLVAAYLAQEAFKEPIMALFLLAFALCLPLVRSAREAVPLGVIAAGVVYVYSFPGLVWLVVTGAVWALAELAAHRWSRNVKGADQPRPSLRPVLVAVVVAAVTALVLVAPDLGRVVEFAHFRALDPDRANVGGLGNVGGQLSPLEALGVWPTSEFRLSAGAGSLPAIAFYAGGALGLLALALGLPRWIRRHGWAIPSALAAAVLVYIGARAFGTVYTSAKALAIASPLILLISLGGLLDEVGEGTGGVRAGEPSPRQAAHAPPSARRVSWTGYRPALAALLVLGAALSSFLVLRQAPVGPTDHMDELAEIRPIVAGEKLLFLGRDNFVSYELRGAKPFTHVRNFYDPFFVKPNFELRNVGFKFDFDSVAADKLARFPYVLTTRASYASGPPPSWTPAAITDSYVLWRQRRSPLGRVPVEKGPEPTAPLRCNALTRDSVVALAPKAPVRAAASGWSPSATVKGGESSTIELDLPPGNWDLSLQYDSTRPVTLSGPGLDAELPGNLDYRGAAPFWPAGRVHAAGGPVQVHATIESPPVVGRVMGASSVAHLGALAANVPAPAYSPRIDGPHPGSGEGLVAGRLACDHQADWTAPTG